MKENRNSCGQMRQRLTGLGQMGRCVFGNIEGNQYLTRLQHQLLNMQGGITSWYEVVWGGMEWGSL